MDIEISTSDDRLRRETDYHNAVIIFNVHTVYINKRWAFDVDQFSPINIVNFNFISDYIFCSTFDRKLRYYTDPKQKNIYLQVYLYKIWYAYITLVPKITHLPLHFPISTPQVSGVGPDPPKICNERSATWNGSLELSAFNSLN